MRGRIINPFVAVLGQLDTQTTTTSGLMREPAVSIDTAGKRTVSRGERLVQCQCQVETGTYEAQTMTGTGNDPGSSLTLVFHYDDLEEAGLLGEQNRPLVQVNDRLVRLVRGEDGETASEFDRVPVYVTEATPSGFGFGGRVNLLVCRLSEQPQAKRG